jgi:hypothetical protein
MNHRTGVRVLAVMLVMFAVSVPAFSQQAKGDSEIGLNGSFIIPHSDPSTTLGIAQISYGYYFRKNDLLGLDSVVIATKGLQDVFLQGRYRHLFSIKNPRIYPFLGAQGGINVTRLTGSPTTHDALGTAEAGLKFFVSQRSAFEIAYNFQYVHQAGMDFANSSSSVISFGFTHLFGGHH